MRKEVAFKNRDRFIQLGIAIASLRKLRGMSQEVLAEKANISRSLLSIIEAPNTANSFSLETLFDIADALDVAPSDLLTASLFPDDIINKEKKQNVIFHFQLFFSSLYDIMYSTKCQVKLPDKSEVNKVEFYGIRK